MGNRGWTDLGDNHLVEYKQDVLKEHTHSDLFPRDDTVPNPEDKSLVRMSTSFCTSLAACARGSPIVNLPLFLIF